jgi:hypothetical protein
MRRIGLAVILTVRLALSSIGADAQQAQRTSSDGLPVPRRRRLRRTSNVVDGRGGMIHQRSCRTTKGAAL